MSYFPQQCYNIQDNNERNHIQRCVPVRQNCEGKNARRRGTDMIREHNGFFELATDQTSYCFHILPSGHPEHLYYGPRIDAGGDAERALADRKLYLGGNGISYSKEYPLVGLEDLCLEFSSLGHGDIRDPFVSIIYPNGSPVSDFLFRKYRITDGKSPMRTLPSAYAEAGSSGVQELTVTFADRAYGAELELIYAVFPECDVITRRSVLRNRGSEPLTVRRLMSLQLDLDDSEYDWHTFTGAWAREFNHQTDRLHQGRFVSESRCGLSSSMNNPFVMLSRPDASETAGLCYGFNLIYSGSHLEEAEVNAYGETRVLTGIQPDGFSWELGAGEAFEAPEAVMTATDSGFGSLSRNMHRFVRRHIVRGAWRDRERPILLNSWEAVYFDFNEEKLLDMARAAADVGIELFVLDDGWFGERNDAKSSLGDWKVNREKLPGGLKDLSEKINALGMKFGIWVEPEMICVRSHLYEEHPDWAVAAPGTVHSEGRNQRILDLTRQDVRDYIVRAMSDVFSSGEISYVKWDNNRIFTDLFSTAGSRPGEFLHRYCLGYYDVMGRLVRAFPDILFEGCASGGNRFDLGVLCYMPQIWASDDTDAVCRTMIQTGISYGYPMSVISAHVSASPNHQTGRRTPWGTRFGTACFGVLGYELNLALLTDGEKENVRRQIAFCKDHRKTLMTGDYYRLESGLENDFTKGVWKWLCVAGDGSEAIGFYLQQQNVPNVFAARFTARGLENGAVYRFRDWQAETGLGAEEDFTLSGSVLNRAGVRLTQAYAGEGNREEGRYFPDGASRIYLIERMEKPEDTGSGQQV